MKLNIVRLKFSIVRLKLNNDMVNELKWGKKPLIR